MLARSAAAPPRSAPGAVHRRIRRVRVSRPACAALGADDLPTGHGMRQVREKITFFTPDGVVAIPGGLVSVPRSQPHTSLLQPLPAWEQQGLVVGATFAVAATNGRDPSRRISILGFCQSLDLLHESVEEVVVDRGGEVLLRERRLTSGVHERLQLTVAIPFLFGVPPEVDALSAAITQGGGIVDRVVQQWGIYRPLQV